MTAVAVVVIYYLIYQHITAAVDVAAVIFISILLLYQYCYMYYTNAIVIIPIFFFLLK